MVFLPIAGLALGAAGMYLFDPVQGRRRRASMRDQAYSRAGQFRHGVDVAMRDLCNRARGARHEWGVSDRHRIPDRVLVERVRAKLGRYTAHPGAIKVAATDGCVVLGGNVLAQEHDTVLKIVRRLRGVQAVRDHMTPHHDAQGVWALQGGVARPGERMAFLQQDWSPAARVMSGGAGSALLLMALRRGGIGGGLAGLAGAALLLRASTNSPLQHWAESRSRRAAMYDSQGGQSNTAAAQADALQEDSKRAMRAPIQESPSGE